MRTLFFFLLLISGIHLNAQQLQFDQVGSDPAYCRLFGYQSGNGVVYASVSGGVPNYTYQMTNLQSGATYSNSTWGGVNPGEYEVKVWDSVNDSISTIVIVDSLNPHAQIGVVSGYDTHSGHDFYNWGPSTYTFVNHSDYFANQWNPNADTTFFWQFNQYDNWQIDHDYYSVHQYDYNFTGLWSVKLVSFNKNGCSDTTEIHIHMYGAPLDVEEETSTSYHIISNASQQQLIVNRTADTQGEVITIYNLSGKVILHEELINNSTNIPFSGEGIFLFEIVNREKGELVQSGKFNF